MSQISHIVHPSDIRRGCSQKIGQHLQCCSVVYGDCLELMKSMPDNSIDAVIADLPFGKTKVAWDRPLDLGMMWDSINRVTTIDAPVCLFGVQPFTSALIMSNLKAFKFCMIWDKRHTSTPAVAKIRPLPAHLDIAIFCRGRLPYFPQMTPRSEAELARLSHYSIESDSRTEHSPSLRLSNGSRKTNTHKYPTTVIRIPAIVSTSKEKVKHSSQKPIALMKYLIRLFTRDADVILDLTAGSGSTLIAALQEHRHFIGFDNVAEHCLLAENRIAQQIEQMELP